MIKSGKKPFARFISKKGKKNKLKIKKAIKYENRLEFPQNVILK